MADKTIAAFNEITKDKMLEFIDRVLASPRAMLRLDNDTIGLPNSSRILKVIREKIEHAKT